MRKGKTVKGLTPPTLWRWHQDQSCRCPSESSTWTQHSDSGSQSQMCPQRSHLSFDCHSAWCAFCTWLMHVETYLNWRKMLKLPRFFRPQNSGRENGGFFLSQATLHDVHVVKLAGVFRQLSSIWYDSQTHFPSSSPPKFGGDQGRVWGPSSHRVSQPLKVAWHFAMYLHHLNGQRKGNSRRIPKRISPNKNALWGRHPW